jgi:anthranilate synthase/aminodeoxychorismate synthase-like glutamine amidotransferase
MRVVLIDNRDSFTYNLEQQLRALGADCIVVPSGTTSIPDIERLHPERIVISPGPGRPEKSGISESSIRYFFGRVPLLGVCLGHQCLASVFCGKKAVIHAPAVMHGKTSLIYHDGSGIMRGLKSPLRMARYHSLIVKSVPPGFVLMCWAGSQRIPELIMGLKHEKEPAFGVQFHPESFLSEGGDGLIRNFLAGRW